MKKKQSKNHPITPLSACLNPPLKSGTSSHEPNDGTFIEDTDLKDGFSAKGTVRYGEEVDVDDL